MHNIQKRFTLFATFLKSSKIQLHLGVSKIMIILLSLFMNDYYCVLKTGYFKGHKSKFIIVNGETFKNNSIFLEECPSLAFINL